MMESLPRGSPGTDIQKVFAFNQGVISFNDSQFGVLRSE